MVSNATSYTVQYKITGSNTWLNAGTVNSPATSFGLSNLTPGTSYDWQVRATCSGGTGNYVQSQFTTTSTVTCNPPTGLSSSNITSSGATVSWAAVSGAASYDVDYSLSGANSWTNVVKDTQSLSVNIKGLSSGIQYDWRVRSNCGTSGSSTYSSSQFTTLAAGCVDALEPNNTLATAAAISVGINLNAEIASPTDVDYYIFSTSGSQKNVQVTLTNLPANYKLTLYNSKGNQVSTSISTSATTETLVYNTNKAGTYYVKVYGATSGDYSSTQCYTLQVLTGSAMFTANAAEASSNTNLVRGGLNLYPVPASTAITISFDAYSKGQATVAIINQLGQEVYNKQVAVSSGINLNNIDVSSLKAGVYILKVNNGQDIQTKKLIITK
ncbi:MAG TPA: T9SS type A sorting domain-containing protein, partial [Ginsengibacter sp.]|nr:T9SS type A sorting domain-containing protein [Ginsengibacter sp.]